VARRHTAFPNECQESFFSWVEFNPVANMIRRDGAPMQFLLFAVLLREFPNIRGFYQRLGVGVICTSGRSREPLAQLQTSCGCGEGEGRASEEAEDRRRGEAVFGCQASLRGGMRRRPRRVSGEQVGRSYRSMLPRATVGPVRGRRSRVGGVAFRSPTSLPKRPLASKAC
jgi:hypothetical protein